MNTSTFHKRLDQAEAALSALQRAYLLVQRGIPPEAWPDAELNAYCDERPECALLTDAELDAIIAAPTGQVQTTLARFLEGHGYGITA